MLTEDNDTDSKSRQKLNFNLPIYLRSRVFLFAILF